MPTIQKFYFHDATTTDTGTLPTTTLGTIITSGDASGASTNRSMDASKGSTQKDISWNVSPAGAAAGWARKFLSAPLAAQTIAAGTWTLGVAGFVPNAADDTIAPMIGVWTWRPGTGAVVTNIFGINLPATGSGWPSGGSETGDVGTFSGGASTVQAGDILVVEIWAEDTTATNGANPFHFDYDGTTDPVDAAAVSSAASYVQAPNPITMSGGAVTETTVSYAYSSN